MSDPDAWIARNLIRQPKHTWGGRLPSFLSVEGSRTEEILAWTGPQASEIGDALLVHLSRREYERGPEPTLQRVGLLTKRRVLTPLGRKLGYHVSEWHRQMSEAPTSEFKGLVDSLRDRRGLTVVDVGSGAGQTLGTMLTSLDVAVSIGIDCEPEVLAFGMRFQETRRCPQSRYICAEGRSLPLADACASLVISRVSLNYMHQRSALLEMMRIAKPGGALVIQAEGAGFDLGLLGSCRSPRDIASRGLDFIMGGVHAVSGRQPTPGSPGRPGRMFASIARIRHVVEVQGCVLTRVVISRRRLGLPVGIRFLISKPDPKHRPRSAP